ncbi:MAG TPA: hypothetical protein VFS67_24940 [Polyangiaceae bacterium]|jgi:hypothetical protein|nr:hypothetical protein [Polyangiaceae bacterium]
MSAKSARRFLERLLCDPRFLDRVVASGVQGFGELSAAEGYDCSLAEVQAVASDADPVPVSPEIWFAALIDAARSAPDAADGAPERSGSRAQ